MGCAVGSSGVTETVMPEDLRETVVLQELKKKTTATVFKLLFERKCTTAGRTSGRSRHLVFEPIDARKSAEYTTSEANKRATTRKSLENHCKLDARRARC